MVKNKLKRLVRAEENKIIKEHEGLYSRLVAENFPQEEVATNPKTSLKPMLKRSYLAVASFALVAVFIIGGFVVFGPKAGMKNDANSPSAPSEVSISMVENMLTYTSLNTAALNIKSISAVTEGGENSYFKIEVETFNTFDLIVKVNPDSDVPESIKPGVNAMQQLNAHGFMVDYTVSRRRLEDCFMYNTKAVVTTDSEVYYIRYNYSSSNSTCELLSLIEECIMPKGN